MHAHRMCTISLCAIDWRMLGGSHKDIIDVALLQLANWRHCPANNETIYTFYKVMMV